MLQNSFIVFRLILLYSTSQYIYAAYSIQNKIKNTNMQKKHIILYTCQDPSS